MKASFQTLTALAAFFSFANAHMKMTDPAPFRGAKNPNVQASAVDTDMTAPLSASGSNFPCKGYHKDATGTESVATWAAGSKQTMTIEGGANHNGGSCQAVISEDKGSSFKVIKSYVGDCPLSGTSTLDFTVPKEAKTGDVIFGWTWFNKVGNREMYMNCAAVTISGGGSGLAAFPDMLRANAGTDCTTAEGKDVAFPDPGKDVTTADTAASQAAPIGGACGASSGGGEGSAPAPSEAPVTPTPSEAPVSPNPSNGTGSGDGYGSGDAKPTTAPTTPPSQKSSPAAAPTPTNGGIGDSPVYSDIPQQPTATSTPTTPSPSAAPAPVKPSPSAAAPVKPSPNTPPPASGKTCTEGATFCNTDGTWSMCGSGIVQVMGAVPAGMKCVDGTIVGADARMFKKTRSVRFSGEHLRRGVGLW